MLRFFLPSRAANSLKIPYMFPLEACLVEVVMACFYSCVFRVNLAPTEHKLHIVHTHMVLAKFATPSFFEAVFSYFGQLGGVGWGHCRVRRPVGQLGGSWKDRTASLSLFENMIENTWREHTDQVQRSHIPMKSRAFEAGCLGFVQNHC